MTPLSWYAACPGLAQQPGRQAESHLAGQALPYRVALLAGASAA